MPRPNARRARFRSRLLTIARGTNYHLSNAISGARPMQASLFRCAIGAIIGACAALAMTSCTITPPPSVVAARTPAPAVPVQTLDDYKHRVAQRIFERNPSLVLKGTPQAMLRSFVVVSFTVDRGGRLVESSVYRTNGDDEAEATALASLRRAAPLPAPPARLLNGNGQLELFEGWMFNDNGQFQLQTSHSPQATAID